MFEGIRREPTRRFRHDADCSPQGKTAWGNRCLSPLSNTVGSSRLVPFLMAFQSFEARAFYHAPKAARPESVSLQMSQPGFTGLANQGSAQPFSIQLLTVLSLTFRPCSSNNGSFPPGWVNPCSSHFFCAAVGEPFASVAILPPACVSEGANLTFVPCRPSIEDYEFPSGHARTPHVKMAISEAELKTHFAYERRQ